MPRRSVTLVYPEDTHCFQKHPSSATALFTNVVFYPSTFDGVAGLINAPVRRSGLKLAQKHKPSVDVGRAP